MPGSGINANNVSHFQKAGFVWVHLSAKQRFPSIAFLFSSPQYGVNISALQEFIAAVKAIKLQIKQILELKVELSIVDMEIIGHGLNTRVTNGTTNIENGKGVGIPF